MCALIFACTYMYTYIHVHTCTIFTNCSTLLSYTTQRHIHASVCKLRRESIIPIMSGSALEPDYRNVSKEEFSGKGAGPGERERQGSVMGKEEVLYTDPTKVVAALNLEVKGHDKQVCSQYANFSLMLI